MTAHGDWIVDLKLATACRRVRLGWGGERTPATPRTDPPQNLARAGNS
jgi:hypothetical protein